MFNSNDARQVLMDCTNDSYAFFGNNQSLQNKNENELRTMAVNKGLINVFQPNLSKENLINLLTNENKNEEIPIYMKNSVWNHYIGKEVGEYPCLLCQVTIITQANFQCGYGNPISKGGIRTLDNLLPICDRCNLSKGTRTINEYLQSINKTRMLFLSEKMKNITENCILDPEIIKTRSMNIFSSNNVNLSDEKICRTIATNSMLW